MRLVSHIVRVLTMADVLEITWFYRMQVDLARYLIQLRADPDARDDTVRVFCHQHSCALIALDIRMCLKK